MKKLFFISTLALVSAISCTKKVLDKAPLDLITDNVVWSDQVLMDAYLTNA